MERHPHTLVESEKMSVSFFFSSSLSTVPNSLCSPVLTPQMPGGALPPGLVTVKRSAKHWPELEEEMPLDAMLPLLIRFTLIMDVEGPVVTKF